MGRVRFKMESKREQAKLWAFVANQRSYEVFVTLGGETFYMVRSHKVIFRVCGRSRQICEGSDLATDRKKNKISGSREVVERNQTRLHGINILMT